MVAAHVFVADLTDPVLDDADRHHLARVLRLRDGEEVSASDGVGGVVRCRFVGGRLEAIADVVLVARTEPPITVAFAPVKGDRPEWAVQKLTEVGVDRIVALRCDRSVVRWDDDRATGHLQRWARVAREAAMQSRRAWLPEIVGVVEPGSFRGRSGAARADQGGDPPEETIDTVLVGPEGGWSPEEREGLPAVQLAGPVLRSETAAVAAGILLCGLRGGLIGRGARSIRKF